MILIIILLVLISLGVVFIKLGEKIYTDFGDYLGVFGFLSTVIGSVCLIVSILMIITAHVTAPKIIQENKLNYEGLCKRYEIITSEYEDVSKSDVIADITAWNVEVYKVKYWTYNPWTSWYNPKEIADNLNYILLE